MIRVFVLSTLMLLTTVTSTQSVLAANTMLYDATRFEQGKAGNRLMLLEFHATWCAACAIQLDHVMNILKDEQYRNLWHYIINFDTEDKVVKTYGVRRQSTLVILKGTKELSRSVGVNDIGELRTFLKTAETP